MTGWSLGSSKAGVQWVYKEYHRKTESGEPLRILALPTFASMRQVAMRSVLVFIVFLLHFSAMIVAQTSPRDLRTPFQARTSLDAGNGLSNGGTTAVQWDNRSLIVQGRRTFVWSGEFHFWRLPVPDLWRDILQKFKAAGFNTVRFSSYRMALFRSY